MTSIIRVQNLTYLNQMNLKSLQEGISVIRLIGMILAQGSQRMDLLTVLTFSLSRKIVSKRGMKRGRRSNHPHLISVIGMKWEKESLKWKVKRDHRRSTRANLQSETFLMSLKAIVMTIPTLQHWLMLKSCKSLWQSKRNVKDMEQYSILSNNLHN